MNDQDTPRDRVALDKGKGVDRGERGGGLDGAESDGSGRQVAAACPERRATGTTDTTDGDDDGTGDDDDDEDSEEDDDEEDDEEPRLKSARLTPHLSSLYRNGDATSAFLVAGDKMIMGTHDGNIHVMQLPILHSLRVYHAHSASVTSVSISPFPPPLPTAALQAPEANDVPTAGSSSQSSHTTPPTGAAGAAGAAAPSSSPKRVARGEPATVPNTPSNNIYIATSSMDGNVCVQSLVDPRDVQLRNFARPVQAVALSPDYRNDRTYLSGGRAGQLILTVGGGPGKSVSTTVGTAAAAASGWLGSMGLGSNTGKDTILHSGEGAIGTIRWSLSGRYVAWLNEHGVKIIRTRLHLDARDSEEAWKRLGHVDRPQTEEWDSMAGVWKGRAEWIDEQAVETDDSERGRQDVAGATGPGSGSPVAERRPRLLAAGAGAAKAERLLVGWGNMFWIIHVHPGSVGPGNHAGGKTMPRAEIAKILRMDCIISGISLYTQNLLLVLAWCPPEDDDARGEGEVEEGGGKDENEEEGAGRGGDREDKTALAKDRKHKFPTAVSGSGEPSGGIRHSHNNQPPELRLIDLVTQAEVDKDGLTMSRYERLSSADYHLGVLPARTAVSASAAQRGAFEAITGLGVDMWNAAIKQPRSLFSSAASVRSRASGDDAGSSGRLAGIAGALRGSGRVLSADSSLAKPGIKIIIHSPYDCIVATKRDLGDHLTWLLERKQYQAAWELLDEHPEIVPSGERDREKERERERERGDTTPTTPPRARRLGQLDTFSETSSTAGSLARSQFSAAEKEKRRIGELWLQELVEAGDWPAAGRACARVLTTPDRWEKWVFAFAGARRLDDVAEHIPTEPLRPEPIARTVFETVLGHYAQHDRPRFGALLDRWWPPEDFYDPDAVAAELENRLAYRDVREDGVEGGVRGRDWRIVVGALARLRERGGQYRDAFRWHVRLRDGDAAFRLIREKHLAEAVADDVAAFVTLRMPPEPSEGGRELSEAEVEEATAEAIDTLVDEARHGLVRPATVVGQLEARRMWLCLFFYLRGLWRGEGITEHAGENMDRLVMESKGLLDDLADLTVRMFARYDRGLLMEFLRSSTSYTFDKAVHECESYSYDDELVYLYSKTGQTKRALYLIIERLHDVPKAIGFAKEQADPDLWDDLLAYSMDKPGFIRGLLEQVGTAINPITLVRRIPEGLEIEGLREGIRRIMKEHEIQWSISVGVARVLRSEVAGWQAELRGGQKRGIKFEVGGDGDGDGDGDSDGDGNGNGDGKVDGVKKKEENGEKAATAAEPAKAQRTRTRTRARTRGRTRGRCAECRARFSELATRAADYPPGGEGNGEAEAEVDATIVGFACGHALHLSHLLEATARTGGGGDYYYDRFGDGEDVRENGSRVGPKVTRARLLRDRIRAGCPVCKRGGSGDGTV